MFNMLEKYFESLFHITILKVQINIFLEQKNESFVHIQFFN